MSDQERRFPCTVCKTEVLADMPAGEIVNKPTFSQLVLVHQACSVCPNCGQAFSFVLRGVKGMEFGWMAVTVQKEDENLIVPPSLVDMEALKKKH